MELLFFAVIGILAGTISGMGIGGGTILIPALTFFMGFSQQQAQGVNLLFFLPTAAVAAVTHAKEKNIEKKLLLKMVIPGILFAVLGSLLAVKINADILRRLFGVFLLSVGVSEFFKKTKPTTNA